MLPGRRDHSGRCFHDDCAGHVRMQGSKNTGMSPVGGARRRDYNGDKPSERAERESPLSWSWPSALQRGVDYGEPLLALLEGDASGTEQRAQLVVRHLHWAG